MRKSAQKRLLNLLIELYGRSQQPILTKNLFKGINHVSVNTDFGVGKDYPLEVLLNTEVLAVHKEWSKGKKEVIWNTSYPDNDMVLRLWKCRKNEVKPKPTKDLVVEDQKPIEVVTEFTGIDELVERFDVEYKKFSPYGTTIPNVKLMLKVLEHNARDRYCHKDRLVTTTDRSEEGIVDINHRPGRQYSNKRLCEFGVLERNPKNKCEYKIIAQYEDLDEFARKVAFVINHSLNPSYYEGLREDRLLSEEQRFIESIQEDIDRDEPVVQEEVWETVVTQNGLQEVINDLKAELRVIREDNQKIRAGNKNILVAQEEVLTELRKTVESNVEIGTDLSQKLIFVHEATLRLADVLKTVNNLISEKQQ